MFITGMIAIVFLVFPFPFVLRRAGVGREASSAAECLQLNAGVSFWSVSRGEEEKPDGHENIRGKLTCRRRRAGSRLRVVTNPPYPPRTSASSASSAANGERRELLPCPAKAEVEIQNNRLWRIYAGAVMVMVDPIVCHVTNSRPWKGPRLEGCSRDLDTARGFREFSIFPSPFP